MFPSGRLPNQGMVVVKAASPPCTPDAQWRGQRRSRCCLWVYSAGAGHELIVRSLSPRAGSAQLDRRDGLAPSEALSGA